MNSSSNFLFITDDAWVIHQRLHIFLIEFRDLGKRELRESFLEVGPLVLYYAPVESRGEN